MADRRPDQDMELHREMAEQVDKHRWVVEAHMDTEGNPTGYWLESDAGDCQYLTAEEFELLRETLAKKDSEGFKTQ